MGKKLEIIKGDRYGRLIIIEEDYSKKRRAFKCKCECGGETIVILDNLRKGTTQSCGCINKKKPSGTKHGMCRTKIYKVWQGMHYRCYYKSYQKYHRYGGRGIKVYDKWHTFEGFYEDMGPAYKEGLQIDRIDNNGNYCKKNCRWATRKEQMRNTSRNIIIEYNGVSKCLTDWAYDLGITHSALSERLNKGWKIKKALTTKSTKNIHTYNGKNRSEWCKELGLGYSMIKNRMARKKVSLGEVLKEFI